MKIPVTITLYTEQPRGVFDDPGTDTRTVFATVNDVGMNEFYTAMSLGLAPEIVFEIAVYSDYKGEKLLTYNGEKFRVIRATRRGMKERLVCGKVDANG